MIFVRYFLFIVPIISFVLVYTIPGFGQDIILPDFHADPSSARLFGQKLYIYPSRDAKGARNGKGMVDWHVFFTNDIVT